LKGEPGVKGGQGYVGTPGLKGEPVGCNTKELTRHYKYNLDGQIEVLLNNVRCIVSICLVWTILNNIFGG